MRMVVSLREGDRKVTVSSLKDGRYSMAITNFTTGEINKFSPFHLTIDRNMRFDEAEKTVCQKLAEKWIKWTRV